MDENVGGCASEEEWTCLIPFIISPHAAQRIGFAVKGTFVEDIRRSGIFFVWCKRLPQAIHHERRTSLLRGTFDISRDLVPNSAYSDTARLERTSG